MNSTNDNTVHYLTVSDLYNINSTIMDGNTWVRDIHLLDSAARRPAISLFGQPQFPTLIDKAAALLHSLAYHHVFIDGNKRTAVRALALFLEHNQHEITWDQQTEYDFVLEIAQGKYDVPQIAQRLELYIRPVA
jgi:death-on-curing protein